LDIRGIEIYATLVIRDIAFVVQRDDTDLVVQPGILELRVLVVRNFEVASVKL
jgi:hypothetical protein